MLLLSGASERSRSLEVMLTVQSRRKWYELVQRASWILLRDPCRDERSSERVQCSPLIQIRMLCQLKTSPRSICLRRCTCSPEQTRFGSAKPFDLTQMLQWQITRRLPREERGGNCWVVLLAVAHPGVAPKSVNSRVQILTQVLRSRQAYLCKIHRRAVIQGLHTSQSCVRTRIPFCHILGVALTLGNLLRSRGVVLTKLAAWLCNHSLSEGGRRRSYWPGQPPSGMTTKCRPAAAPLTSTDCASGWRSLCKKRTRESCARCSGASSAR
mmetsp:Transcript_170615/g.541984  ORF Transcript_170615/g.541984 Transcript_170615/m.541984 type:complete len:269 (-) Transcript_170615:443-1249(-)